MRTWKQLSIRELLLLTIIAALGLLLFAEHRRLNAERIDKAALQARLDRQSAALPYILIEEPRPLTDHVYRKTANIAVLAEVHLPERHAFKGMPQFKVELLESASLNIVYEAIVPSSPTTEQRRFALVHTIDHKRTDLKPGYYLVRVHLLNEEEKSVIHATSFVRLVDN